MAAGLQLFHILGSPEEDVSPRTLRSTTPVFDITSHCLFCSEIIPTSGKLSSKRRKLSSNVETIEFKDSVLKRARERCDEWGNLGVSNLYRIFVTVLWIVMLLCIDLYVVHGYCLSCSASNCWKAWPGNFIFGLQVQVHLQNVFC